MMTLMDRRRLMFATLNKYLPASEQTIKNSRVTAGGTTIGDGEARISEIKGNSLVWNQLCDIFYTLLKSGLENYGLSVVVDSNGDYILNGTIDANTAINLNDNLIPFIQGHKYLCRNTTLSGVNIYNGIGAGTSAGANWITTANSTTSTRLGLYIKGNTVFDNYKLCRPQLFDLTLMFGEGKEPSTVEEFESVFPLPYYGYNAGEIINTTCAKTERVMWNQLVSPISSTTARGITITNNGDGSLTLSGIAESSGNVDLTGIFALVQGHRYFIYIPKNTANIRIINTYWGSWTSGTVNSAIVSSSRTGNEKLGFSATASNNYSGDITINLIDLTLMFGSGNEPTLQECEEIFTEDYYPYDAGTQKTLTLEDGGIESRDSNNTLIDTLYTKLTTMKGKLNGTGESVVVFPDGPARAGTAYDQVIVDNDGWCRRVRKNVEKVDLGTKGWSVPSAVAGVQTTYTSFQNKAAGPNLLCSKYISGSFGNDKVVLGHPTTKTVYIVDDSLSGMTKEQVKEFLKGVELLYQLETPKEYILDEPIFLGYNAQNGGTENILPLDTQDRPAVPLIADIKYRKP